MAKNFKGQYQSRKEIHRPAGAWTREQWLEAMRIRLDYAQNAIARFFRLWREAIESFGNACRYAAERMRERAAVSRKEIANGARPIG